MRSTKKIQWDQIRKRTNKKNIDIFIFKFGLLNIRSLALKALLVNEIITDLVYDIKPLLQDMFIGMSLFRIGCGGGVATIFSDILNDIRRYGLTFNSFEELALNAMLADI